MLKERKAICVCVCVCACVWAFLNNWIIASSRLVCYAPLKKKSRLTDMICSPCKGFIFFKMVRTVSLLNVDVIQETKKKKKKKKPTADVWKNNHVGFHANVCVNQRMSEIENRNSTFPMYAHIKKKKKKIKKVLFRAFQLPDASKPFLMQTQQKHGQLESAELSHSLLLSSLSLSDLLLWLHYTFSFSRCFIQFV